MKKVNIIMRMLLKEKKDVLLSVVFGFIAGLTAVGLFSASGYLISQAALAPPIYTLMVIVAMVKLLGITSAISRYGERYFSHRGTFTMLKNLRVYVYDKIEPLAASLLQRYRSGEVLARIVGDVESLQHFFLRVFYPPIVLVTVMLTTIVFTTVFSFGAAVTIFFGMILLVFIMPWIFLLLQGRLASSVRKQRGELSSEFTDYLYGFQELTIYQKAETKQQQLFTVMERYEQEKLRENRRRAVREAVLIFLSFLLALIVLVQVSFYVTTGSLSGILLAMLFMIALTVFEDIPSMAAFPAYLEESKQASERLSQVWEGDQEPKGTLRELDTTEALTYRLDNVSLCYPNQALPSVEGVSFNIPQGSKTAIVGASGSGKSTLMQAMLGFLPVVKGQLLVNDTPIETWGKESLWRQLNVSLQQNHFFFGTVHDNIALANPEAGEETIREALAKVHLEHLSLNDHVQENGANLSGGEKQRLALARLLIYPAQTWLLDEPTSSLDAITEEQIMDQLYQQTTAATFIIIRHRLVGLEKMDQIIVMDQGKVVETGTYQELISKKNGYFQKMKQLEDQQIQW
ncbi:thiol reductant ABC exporter subunit CydC [Gracilibacillus alcaliphilus]|uniref:thiol reductant ABC exporter subunit CydC n=1 Tax=Gracilibacillus alcaliphilus TaxID=1401441 RepID=UPI00195DB25F|nr:thiol reductant ABC exporter subunit CydC [Gracilibacillus alcaliphilus]MBM7677139.1 ATP-binding cassette subfamily C protein CydC [Gracilibacillus alcaliphilus]